MNAQECLKLLKLPESLSFAEYFDRSNRTFTGIPESMTMDYLEKYAPWIGFAPANLPRFAAISQAVSRNEALQRYAHHAHQTLFIDDPAESRYGEWPDLTGFFGDDAGIFDLMTAMGAIGLWCETHRKLGIPETFSRAAAGWIDGAAAIYQLGHQQHLGISRRQTYWLRHHIDGQLFRIGRFEYMVQSRAEYLPEVFIDSQTNAVVALAPDGWGVTPDGFRSFTREQEIDAPIHTRFVCSDQEFRGTPIHPKGFVEVGKTLSLMRPRWRQAWQKDDLVPGLHIPGGGKMSIDSAIDSFRQALDFFPRYLHREMRGVSCFSWIFNPSFIEELPDSNLAKLMNFLHLFPEYSSGKDGLFFVFGRDDNDPLQYPAENSIQKAFQQIMRREKLKSGGMFILPHEIRQGQSHHHPY